jgi:hypothetical protein
MENTLTAQEFLDKNSDYVISPVDLKNDITDAMIEFAKLHVEAALIAVNLNVKLLVDNNEEYREPGEGEDLVDYYQCGSDTVYVSSASILEAYPLTNIK